MRIGDVAALTGLSLRTIRYYEEAGLVVASARTAGRFRLYTDADCVRLQLIKRMKPLGFSLDEMRDLLKALDELAGAPSAETNTALHGRLERFADSVDERRELLDKQLAAASELAALLRSHSARNTNQD
jgi:DNA-binding transcriptional MerR regulator